MFLLFVALSGFAFNANSAGIKIDQGPYKLSISKIANHDLQLSEVTFKGKIIISNKNKLVGWIDRQWIPQGTRLCEYVAKHFMASHKIKTNEKTSKNAQICLVEFLDDSKNSGKVLFYVPEMVLPKNRNLQPVLSAQYHDGSKAEQFFDKFLSAVKYEE